MSTTKWVLDPTHSELHFKVRHMMISHVTGGFTKFEATVETEGDDFSTAKIDFSADADSISTNNAQRDGHLKSAEFFDTANHPKITFSSTEFAKVTDDTYKLTGNLTLHGFTHPITLDVDFGGIAKDPWGHTRAGFSLTGKLNRSDYGIVFNAALETGGVMLGEEVKISVNGEFVKA